MKKTILIVLSLLVTSGGLAHGYFSDRGGFTTEPVFKDLGRSVTGNDLISIYDPGLILHVDQSFRYIGGQKFVLYGVADTEQHFFIRTTPDNK